MATDKSPLREGLSGPTPQLSYKLKTLSEDIEESDGDGHCVSSYFDADEDEYGEEKFNGLPQHLYLKWRKAALVVCSVSIAVEFLLGIVSLVFSFILRSPGTFGVAIDSVTDIATTMVVVWRFCGAAGAQFSFEREQRAVYGISVLFILSSFAVFAKAIFDLVRSNKPYNPYTLLILASVSMFIYTAMGWAKYSISQKLRSHVLFSDAVNTFCVDLMACMVLVSLLVYKYTSTWFIGSIVAMLISTFLLSYGARNIYKIHTQKRKKGLLSDYESD